MGWACNITIDLAGRVRFGPDVEWLQETDPERLDYTVDEHRAEVFYAAIRRYWPGLPDGGLLADYGRSFALKSQSMKLFRLISIMQGPKDHGVAGLVNLLGIESPGLTSALAIAEYTAQQLID